MSSDEVGVGRGGARWRVLLLGLLLAMAAISTVQGIRNGVDRSQDFQWSGARAVLHHIDPWAEYLRGDPNHVIYMQQNPNYLPVLYVLIAPVGYLPPVPAKAVWAVCNLLFAVASAVIAARFYRMRGAAVVAAVCLLLMSTPVRNTFGNGQQALFVLFLWCASLLHRRLGDGRAAIAGISYFKFNFAPATFLYLLLRGGVRAAAMSLLPSVLATVGLWLWLGGAHDPAYLGRLVVEPLLVSRTGYYPSGTDSNLMDVMETVLSFFHIPAAVVQVTTLAGATVVCFAVLFAAVRRRREASVQWGMALMATMNFGLFRHHPYDGAVLLLPLCYAMSLWRERRAQVVLGLMAFLWYVRRLVDMTGVPREHLYVLEWVMLMAILYLTYRLRAAEMRVYPDTVPAAGDELNAAQA